MSSIIKEILPAKLSQSAINIETATKSLGITIDTAEMLHFTNSVTNSFIRIRDKNHKQYLIRVNGNLWPPFTRENEDHNLRQLEKVDSFYTNVIFNSHALGIQVCILPDESRRLINQIDGTLSNFQLIKIAHAIRKVHEVRNYKGYYPLLDTLQNSFKYYPVHHKKSHTQHYLIATQLIIDYFSENHNFVLCHNDLIPSSVYIDETPQAILVDYEYSGANHPAYDIALFSLYMDLNAYQEQLLVENYISDNSLSIKQSVTLVNRV